MNRVILVLSVAALAGCGDDSSRDCISAGLDDIVFKNPKGFMYEQTARIPIHYIFKATCAMSDAGVLSECKNEKVPKIDYQETDSINLALIGSKVKLTGNNSPGSANCAKISIPINPVS
jgi:hypothetical protein